jgi:DNA-binding transcriptional MerR regulator
VKQLRRHYPATTSDAAAYAGCSVASLILYEQQGIVRPDRDSANRRLYLPADVQAIKAHRAKRAKRK